MKIHHFPKDAIAMSNNEANAIKERTKQEVNHGTEHTDTDVPGGRSDERPAEATSENGGAGGSEAQTRPTKKTKKAKKVVQAEAKEA